MPSLMTLPGELRNLIFSEIMLGHTHDIDQAELAKKNGAVVQHPLAQVSRQLRAEFEPIFRLDGHKTPSLTMKVLDFHFEPLKLYLLGLEQTPRAQMPKLTVTLDCQGLYPPVCQAIFFFEWLRMVVPAPEGSMERQGGNLLAANRTIFDVTYVVKERTGAAAAFSQIVSCIKSDILHFENLPAVNGHLQAVATALGQECPKIERPEVGEEEIAGGEEDTV